MKQSLRILFCLALTLFIFSGLSTDNIAAMQEDTAAAKKQVNTVENDSFKSGPVIYQYASLPELVEEVCVGAMDHFYNFFGPGTVDVMPLEVIGELPGRRVTMFGITIADQMAARVSNDHISKLVMEGADQQQFIMGVLQEMDGYLRIHISGVNVRGERRSYVVNVEMSELLYRALHTYVAA